MRLLIDIIDWEYPSFKDSSQPRLWDTQNPNTLMDLFLAYGNGIIVELRAEGENEKAIELLRGIVKGVGSSKKIELSLEEKQSLWFYQNGDV